MLRTIIDEVGDTWPELTVPPSYEGPAHLTVRVRSLALKRALTNLVTNAVKYGGTAWLRLHPPDAGITRIEIEDNGPGLPPAELERVLEPFHRVQTSRNRETGEVGPGLPIARNILRTAGGDVTLANRPEGGARATVALQV